MLNPPPPTPKSVYQKRHLQSPAKGVLIFSTRILLLGCLRSHEKENVGKQIGKNHGEKKFVNFLIPHGKRICIPSQTNSQLLHHTNKNVGMDQKTCTTWEAKYLLKFLATDMSQRCWPPRRSPRHWPSWCRTWPTSEKRDDKLCVYVCYHFLIKRFTISCDYVCSLL